MLQKFKGSHPDLASPGQPVASKPSPLSAPAADQRNIATSVIGPELTILGNLSSKGEMQIDGEIQGDIQSPRVVIGAKARITGGIVAEEVVVRGHVMGSIRGKRVMLHSSSHVEGDIFHQSLGIEQGASFEGKSQRSQNPTGDLVPPDIPFAKHVL